MSNKLAPQPLDSGRKDATKPRPANASVRPGYHGELSSLHEQNLKIELELNDPSLSYMSDSSGHAEARASLAYAKERYRQLQKALARHRDFLKDFHERLEKASREATTSSAQQLQTVQPLDADLLRTAATAPSRQPIESPDYVLQPGGSSIGPTKSVRGNRTSSPSRFNPQVSDPVLNTMLTTPTTSQSDAYDPHQRLTHLFEEESRLDVVADARSPILRADAVPVSSQQRRQNSSIRVLRILPSAAAVTVPEQQGADRHPSGSSVTTPAPAPASAPATAPALAHTAISRLSKSKFSWATFGRIATKGARYSAKKQSRRGRDFNPANKLSRSGVRYFNQYKYNNSDVKAVLLYEKRLRAEADGVQLKGGENCDKVVLQDDEFSDDECSDDDAEIVSSIPVIDHANYSSAAVLAALEDEKQRCADAQAVNGEVPDRSAIWRKIRFTEAFLASQDLQQVNDIKSRRRGPRSELRETMDDPNVRLLCSMKNNILQALELELIKRVLRPQYLDTEDDTLSGQAALATSDSRQAARTARIKSSSTQQTGEARVQRSRNSDDADDVDDFNNASRFDEPVEGDPRIPTTDSWKRHQQNKDNDEDDSAWNQKNWWR
jgi:hypothetical protein